MQDNIQISSVNNGASRLSYAKISGGEKLFVLLPGLFTKSLMPLAPFAAMQYRRFLDKYTIYMLDRVDEPPEGYTAQNMANDTLLALEALGVKDANVMGTSAGGIVAQMIAAKCQDMVSRLVVGSSTCKMAEQGRKIIGKWAELARQGRVSELNQAFASAVYTDTFYAKYEKAIMTALDGTSSGDLRRFAIFAEALLDLDITDDIAKISCPVLAIGADKDKIFGAEHSREIARLTGGNAFIYEQYGHAAYDEAPDYLDKVNSFFNTISTQRR